MQGFQIHPRGLTVTYAKLFGMLFLSLSLLGAKTPPKDAASGEDFRSQASSATSPAQTSRTTPKSEEAPKQDRGCRKGNDDRSSDLCAQWKAADAAFESAQWSWWQLVIGAIGAILGSITMVAAIAAAVFAKRAAVEAKRSADASHASRDDFVNAERGRVMINFDSGAYRSRAGVVTLRYSLYNSGRTVAEARLIKIWVSGVVSAPNDEDFDEVRMINASVIAGAEDAICGELNFHSIPVSIFVSGYVEYDTTLTHGHRKHFLFQLDERPDHPNILSSNNLDVVPREIPHDWPRDI